MGTALSENSNSALDQLNDGQRRFVLEYSTHYNATKAALAAGYTENAPSEAGYELLRNPQVAAAVAEQMELQGITAERVKSEIAEIAFGADLADFEGFLDGDKLVDLRENGADVRLLKSVAASKTTTTTNKGEDRVIHETRRMEIHDRLMALKQLVRVLKIVTPAAAPVQQQAQGQSQGMSVFLNIPQRNQEAEPAESPLPPETPQIEKESSDE